MLLRDNRGQWGIVALIVTVALMAVFAYLLWPTYMGNSTPGIGQKSQGVMNGGPATPLERGQGIECANDLQQIRSAINMYKQSNEQAPASLSDLSSYGITGEMLRCPISKQPYSYDPSQGMVYCTTPGHEKF